MKKGFHEFRTDAVGTLIADKMLTLTLEQLMEEAYGMGWEDHDDFDQASEKEREGQYGTTLYLDRHIADTLTRLRGERMASLDDVLLGLIRSYRNVLARSKHLYRPSYRTFSDQQPAITAKCSCGWAGPTYTMTRSSLEVATALWHAHQTQACSLAEEQDDPHQREQAESQNNLSQPQSQHYELIEQPVLDDLRRIGSDTVGVNVVIADLLALRRGVLAEAQHIFRPYYESMQPASENPTIKAACSCGRWEDDTRIATQDNMFVGLNLWYAHLAEVGHAARIQIDPRQQGKAEVLDAALRTNREEPNQIDPVLRPNPNAEAHGVNRYHRIRLIELFAYGESEFQVSCSCAWESGMYGSRTKAISAWEEHVRPMLPVT